MTATDSSLARNGMVFAIVAIVHVALLYGLSRIRSAKLSRVDEFRSTWIVIDSAMPNIDKPKTRSKYHSTVTLPTETDNRAITVNQLPSELDVESPQIDWRAQGAEAVDEIVTRRASEEERRAWPTKHEPYANDPVFLPPVHKNGDTEHFDDGEIATWIDGRCYATNKDFGEQRGNANSLVLVCKGNVGKPPIRRDMFDHLKPSYLRDPERPSDKTDQVDKTGEKDR
jgi:hypothetical protein